MTETMRNATSASRILRKRLLAGRPERAADIECERVNADVAQMVYDIRKEAGLTQRALAKKVGTTASVISRLEDADYTGHSLNMLQRIAAAVGCQIEVRFKRPCEFTEEAETEALQPA
ncbi:MAG TPA: helix-turn-helix transcriptional regulator [Armatimonadota bacterium]|jgi:ribosome-binding protein aMBF1 (putative translation factor)